MKPEPSPFPCDASYHGERAYQNTKLLVQIERLEAGLRRTTCACVLLAIALLIAIGIHYPKALVIFLFFALLVALAGGGVLYLMNRGNPEIGVK